MGGWAHAYDAALPTHASHIPPQGLTRPGCKGGPFEAVLLTWNLCSDIVFLLSRTLGKPYSCFCASYCVPDFLGTYKTRKVPPDIASLSEEEMLQIGWKSPAHKMRLGRKVASPLGSQIWVGPITTQGLP